MIQKSWRTGVRAIAVIEAAKGAVVLLAGLGLLSLIHRDLQEIAERIVRLSRLDPASHYPQIFLNVASKLTDAHLWFMAMAAAFYSAIRGIEAYGLWKGRRWAEWFALASTSLYLPIEIYEVIHHITRLKLAILLINFAVAAYMAYALFKSTDRDREAKARE